ncbi:MAG: hypothetical protein M3065_03525 [Actinomycetota bacterium]|nr:hypothetical protein [Actinomycetota bacterium]
MADPTADRMFDLRSPGLLAAGLPFLSAIAYYGVTACMAAVTGDACGGRPLPGPEIVAGIALLVVMASPPLVVIYRAIVARKSWKAIIGLVLGTVALTMVAVSFAGLAWAGGHNCLG